MRKTFWILASHTLECNIDTFAIRHILESRDYSLALGEVRVVDSLNVWRMFLDKVETPVLVNENDARGTVHVCKVDAHLADWTGAPDRDYIAFLDARVDDTVPACADYVGEEKTLFVGHVIGEFQEVDIANWYADVLCLAAGEASTVYREYSNACLALRDQCLREMRVTKHA